MSRPAQPIFVVIGNPGNRRTVGWQQARARLGLPPALVAPYAALVPAAAQGRAALREALAAAGVQPGPSGRRLVLRLDAPGEAADVERELLALGAPDARGDDALHEPGDAPRAASLTMAQARSLAPETGRLVAPAQWYRGWCRLLAALRREAAAWPQARWLNDPAEVAVMFDKRRCQRRLAEAGVPIPAPLSTQRIADYEAMREAMRESRRYRLFIKLASGSGASGVIAYELNPRTGAERALTTLGVERRGGEASFYNGRLRRYTDSAEIRELVDWLCAEGAQIERWIEKTSCDGRSLDLRQLVVDGEACHRLARLSASPITNLHLGGERRAPEATGLSPEQIAAAAQTAVQALGAFPRSFTAGVDVLIHAATGQACVADVNPFGDLLYRCEHDGLDPYAWQTARLQLKENFACPSI